MPKVNKESELQKIKCKHTQELQQDRAVDRVDKGYYGTDQGTTSVELCIF